MNKTPQKRVAAIHDISCVGRCSLTVALPIISAAGHDCGVLPTAVLSTHTGGFENFTYRDLTDDISPISNHWQSLGLNFDAMYSGFLGSFEQIDLVAQLFKTYKTKDSIILVDPVMADNGQLYAIYSPEMAKGMAKLCASADIIIPNITEACFMVDEEYKEGPYDKAYIENLLKKLAALGPKQVVLTGVYFDNDKLGAAVYNAEDNMAGNKADNTKNNKAGNTAGNNAGNAISNKAEDNMACNTVGNKACNTVGNKADNTKNNKADNKIEYVFADRIEGYFHGTGDVFGSAFLSALLNDFALVDAAQIACDYVCESIRITIDLDQERRYGVAFERALPGLVKKLGLMG